MNRRLERGARRTLATGLAALVVAHALITTNAKADTQVCSTGPFVQGVDVSGSGNGSVDWSQAAGAGIGFAFMKATQGIGFTDSEFSANWSGTKAAGIVRGAFHFFDGTVSGVDQANYFLGVVGTIEPGDFPPVLDIECPDGTPGDDCLGNGSSGAASGAVLTQAMNDFLTTVKAATGRTPIVYSYGSWFSDNGVTTTGLASYPLWIADLSGTSCFDVPTPWTSAVIWQYSFTGNVAGIGSGVDLDQFMGTMAQLTAFLGSGVGPISDAGPPPEEDAGTSCFVTTLGVSGECILTSACAALANHVSTPGYCPGATDIECCTSTLPPEDASTLPESGPGIPDSSAPGMTDSSVASVPDSGAVTTEDSGGGPIGPTGVDGGAEHSDAGLEVSAAEAKAGCACRAAGSSASRSDADARGALALLLLGAVLGRRRLRAFTPRRAKLDG